MPPKRMRSAIECATMPEVRDRVHYPPSLLRILIVPHTALAPPEEDTKTAATTTLTVDSIMDLFENKFADDCSYYALSGREEKVTKFKHIPVYLWPDVPVKDLCSIILKKVATKGTNSTDSSVEMLFMSDRNKGGKIKLLSDVAMKETATLRDLRYVSGVP
eukprot:PhF_6_TR41092/c0_g1_i1/m.62248